MISFNREECERARQHHEVCGARERTKRHRAYQRRAAVAKWRTRVEEARWSIRRRRYDRKLRVALKRVRERQAANAS